MKKFVVSILMTVLFVAPAFAFGEQSANVTAEQLRGQITSLKGKIVEQLQMKINILQGKIVVLLQQQPGGALPQPTQIPGQPIPTKSTQPPGQKDRNLFYSNIVTGDWIKKWYEPIWNGVLAKPEHQRVFHNFIQTASYIYLKDTARIFVLGAGRNNVYSFQNLPLYVGGANNTIPDFTLTNVTFTVEIPEGVKVLRATTGSLSPRATPQAGDLEGIIDGNTVTWNIPTLAMTLNGNCNAVNGCYTFHIDTDGGETLTEPQIVHLKWHVSGNGGTQDTEWGQIIGAVQPAPGTSSGFTIIMPSGTAQ